MSEYQYYEFRAVDRPLNPDQMSKLRALSSRALITPTSFQNTYNYGDFRGNPRDLMKLYFDAHVYISNFGVCNFMLRLPRAALSVDDLAPYAAEDVLDHWTTKQHTILEWRLEDEPSGEWVEGEEWMASLLPIRDELARGDYRSLYIGWLGSVGAWESDYGDEEDPSEEVDADNEDEDDGSGVMEPPVPPGLKHLTAAQSALADFLQIDRDLIEAAAAASPDLSDDAPSPDRIPEWVSGLPDEEVRAQVVRVTRGEGLAVQAELQSRYHRSTSEPATRARDDGPRRTAGQLLALAEETTREREQREKEEQTRRNHERLAALVPRFPALWAAADTAAQKQIASGYKEACTLLVDLRDAYVQAGRRSEFEDAFAKFWAKHGGRTALRRRLVEVGLVSVG